MHILMFVLIGVVLLAVMHYGPRLTGLNVDGAWYFLWLWLIVSVLNGLYGHIRVGIPVVNEIGAFIPIYGIPAALAWFLMRRG